MLVQLTCPSRYLDSFGELGLFDTRLLGASARDAVHVYRINFLFFSLSWYPAVTTGILPPWRVLTVRPVPSAHIAGVIPFSNPEWGHSKKMTGFLLLRGSPCIPSATTRP